ncbi:MAG: class D beta-lactamase [Sphingomonas sp.]|jgi:beta-lactamase class D|uniref:class D beta-lactamase n=1 Tax=Sphingomonas sp. TaxID=28214 RepID=UPI003565BEC2
MTIDRRTFTTSLLLGAGAGIAGLPRAAEAIIAPSPRATLLIDQATGKVLHRSGQCAARFSPCSTFKIPLALMGYDAGILKDAHTPAWDYDPRIHEAVRDIDKASTDPTRWEKDSVIWYSREITKRLGAAKFKAYVDRLNYGNRDVTGDPGKANGLSNAWLGSSLMISPDEQVAFLRRMLAHKLLSAQACARTEAILPVFEGSGGWRVHGKTGSGWLKNRAGGEDRTRQLGWFVGWADKAGPRGKRRVTFAHFQMTARPDQPGGFTARTELLAMIGRLAG